MQEVWIPAAPMDPGAGFGRPKCVELLVNDTPWADLEFRGADGQASVVVGMHIRHKQAD